MSRSAGIHHITAIAGEPRRHVAFYWDVLGLRLVKRTVNFDDPSTWHLYYGDETGSPGTALTFFIWEQLPSGRHGAGEAQEIAFAIPEAALEFWRKRLSDKGIAHRDAPARFGEAVIAFPDPDGQKLELVATKAAGKIPGWSNGEIRAEDAIRGFHGITLEVANPAATGRVLAEVFGFEPAGTDGNRHRFRSAGAAIGTVVDLRVTPGTVRASQGTGTVHHVAFRAGDDEQEMEFRKRALELGLRATDQVSRHYISAQSISASPMESCSRSPPTIPASPSTSRARSSAGGSCCRRGTSSTATRSRLRFLRSNDASQIKHHNSVK